MLSTWLFRKWNYALEGSYIQNIMIQKAHKKLAISVNSRWINMHTGHFEHAICKIFTYFYIEIRFDWIFKWFEYSMKVITEYLICYLVFLLHSTFLINDSFLLLKVYWTTRLHSRNYNHIQWRRSREPTE